MDELSSAEAYSLLAATVVPRPIAFVSTVSPSGVANLAPFSFFMTGGSNPPSLIYSPTLDKNGKPKDSLRNVVETEEFVVNSVHREMVVGMNATSAWFPPESSEWEASGFTPTPSVAVLPARVTESLVQYECKLFNVVEHGEGPNAARYIIGEIVVAHVREDVWMGGELLTGSLRLVSRMGGPNYVDTSTGEVFQVIRPQ